MTAAALHCVGIAGGTGSGKTYLARALHTRLGPDISSILPADCYYHDLSHLPPAERRQVNFDHPDALDIDLMVCHLQTLRSGQPVRLQAYDFKTHCRTAATVTIEPRPIIIVEGLLVLACQAIVDLLDLKVYIDEKTAVRQQRRIERDTRERGRTAEMCASQYKNHVLPMHARFVEPSRHQADIILNSSDDIERVLTVLRGVLAHAHGAVRHTCTAAPDSEQPHKHTEDHLHAKGNNSLSGNIFKR